MNRKQKRAQIVCDLWNAAHPVGTDVTLKRDSGQVQETKTRSEAYVCNAGYSVIFLENVTGYYLLDRVTHRVAPPVQATAEPS